MVKFLHLSDLHIHKSMKKTDNICAKKVVSYIVKKYKNDTKLVIIITGDIVDDGNKTQYKKAVTILKPLVENNFEVLAVPGNHDYGKFGNIYTKKAQGYFRKFILGELLNNKKALDTSIDYKEIFPTKTIIGETLLIGVDSALGNLHDETFHFASGEVGEPQREKIRLIFNNEKYKAMAKVIFFHHHPFMRDITMEMDDAKEVMKILSGNVDICCFGHKHESQTWSSKDNIDWLIAAGKTTKRNSNYKFQYREITVDGTDNDVNMVTFKSD
jgi:predicted MPP superfamily phosphohydrolase